MGTKCDHLTFEYINERLRYEPETGNFYWRYAVSDKIKAGKLAGTNHDVGYRIITLDRNLMFAHRVAWLLSYGEWPNKEIDHINKNKADNRLCNLREATRGQNGMNQGPRSHNSTGLKGIYINKQRGGYDAICYVGGKRIYLGWGKTPTAALAIYRKKINQYHGEFSCPS